MHTFERLEGRDLFAVWISPAEIRGVPTSGPAWDSLVQAAGKSASAPDLSDQNDSTDQVVLAKALVYARTGDQTMRAEARDAIMKAIGTEDGGRTLALGRNLAPYVIAADYIQLDGPDEVTFRAWLRGLLTENLDGRTLVSTHEDRPNNWGTMAGASRAAVAVYLGDRAEIERTVQVFKGYLGDRSAYSGFDYGDLSWQADPSKPVGVNPKGATKQGVSIDGALPEEMRRGGSFTTGIPAATGYPWEALQGAFVQAEILLNAGYIPYAWSDSALLRAVDYLYDLGWPAEGDDEWQVHLINARYGTSYPEATPARHGKIMGWTDWTHAKVVGNAPPVPSPAPAPTPEPQEPDPEIGDPVVNEREEVPVLLAWQNPRNRYDVDDNGAVVPLDVLHIVNVLNEVGSVELPELDDRLKPPPYVDVNGDGHLSPLDSLVLINRLNEIFALEGESFLNLLLSNDS